MKQSSKTIIAVLIAIILSAYFLINSDYYETNQLEHLDDRIKFGRLQFHRKADIKVGNLQIHNRQKIFTINFKNQPLFVGQMEHFLILMQAKGTIKNNGGNIFDIEDEIQKICKIQRILSIYPDQQALTVELQGSFQDCKDAQYKLIFKQTDDNKLQIRVQAQQEYQRAYLLFHHEKSNHYYGLGEQFSYLNLGHDRPYSTFTRQKGIGRGTQPQTFLANFLYQAGGSYFTSQAPAPIWISSKRAAYILNSHHYMAWINNKVLVWGNNFTITYIKQNTYKQLIKDISQINGYTHPIPEWVNKGAILGIQGTPQQVLNKYMILKKQGTKITGLQLEDWVSKRQNLGYSKYWWNYAISQKDITNWDQLTQQLKNDGVQILIQISSILSDPSPNSQIKKNLFKIAQQMGYFVKLKNNQTFKTKAATQFEAALIDFQDQEAVKFFKYLIEHALNDTAANGLMADFSEAYPVQASAQTTQQGAKMHNQYPNIYLENVHKIIKEIKGQNNDFYIFSKAGNLNSPKYTGSLWTGDHSMDFNFHTGLPSCLTAILSSGLVGYSNTHCDIGGHVSLKRKYVTSASRSQILLVRWMQLSAFTSVFRNHEENHPEQTLEVYSNRFLARTFAFYSNVYGILSSYRKYQAERSQNMGLPLIRALFLELDGLEGTEQIQDQFYLGEQILVSPYLSQDNEIKYFLPKGEWKIIWDGKIFKGCDCERRWKNELPPVFIRSSSKFSSQIVNEIGLLIQQYKDVAYETSSKSLSSSDL